MYEKLIDRAGGCKDEVTEFSISAEGKEKSKGIVKNVKKVQKIDEIEFDDNENNNNTEIINKTTGHQNAANESSDLKTTKGKNNFGTEHFYTFFHRFYKINKSIKYIIFCRFFTSINRVYVHFQEKNEK